jgi:hypothetical protein
VPTLRLNVRSACSGRSNDRPLGDIRARGRVSPKNSQQDDVGGRSATRGRRPRTKWLARQRAPTGFGLPPRPYPSGRTKTVVGAVIASIAGSSHVPKYSASTSGTRSAHGVMSKPPDSPRLRSTSDFRQPVALCNQRSELAGISIFRQYWYSLRDGDFGHS